MKRVLLIVIVTLLVLGGVLYVLLEPIRRTAVVVLSEDYTPSGDGALAATFSDADGAQRGSIDLVPRVADLEQPVEIAFPPGQPGIAVILERKGRALWVDRGDGSRGTLLSIDVLTRSEQGLLGIAFHPGFASNGRFFLNYVARRDGEGTTVIEEWRVEPGASLKTAQAEARLTELEDMLASAGSAESFGDVLSSPLIQKLREQEAGILRTEAELATKYGDKHPRMIKVRAELEDIQRTIRQEVAKVVSGLRSELVVAKAREGTLAKNLKELQQQQARMFQPERDIVFRR